MDPREPTLVPARPPPLTQPLLSPTAPFPDPRCRPTCGLQSAPFRSHIWTISCPSAEPSSAPLRFLVTCWLLAPSQW